VIETDPINIGFTIPAQDHLGRETVLGKLRFLPGHVELTWRLEGNVFTGGKGQAHVMELPYKEIDQVELRRRWFKPAELELHIDDPSLLAEMPGIEMGKMVLQIDNKSKEEIERLRNLIDYKRSVFLLDEQTERLKAVN